MPLLKTRSSAMYRRTDAKRKEKRFLLTKNEKDFFDNAAVPFHRTHGIIAIHGDMSNILDYAIAIEHLLQLIVQYGEMSAGSKIRLKPNDTNGGISDLVQVALQFEHSRVSVAISARIGVVARLHPDEH